MKILAVDYGDSRTGLAICDEGEILASPLKTLFERNFDRCVEQTAQAAQENHAKLIIVGDPVNMNGTRGERSEKCTLFAKKLRELVEVPVRMWDERSSTVTAITYMNEINKRGKKRKEVLDQAAAAVILESFLQYRKNHPEEN
ncbi:MAG: Holliday junction resolvase RuvX [Ruminococcaceae bacterium]|nr:Holliday junction resolvase RuvX [Oscillospiraceae bacterium]